MSWPKPEKRAPRPRKRIDRGAAPKRKTPLKRNRVRIASVSAKNGQVRKADAEWSKYVRDVAEGQCERSGCQGAEAHHIWPKKAHPKLRHITLNGIWLTRREHNRAHSDMKAFRAWFASRFPDCWAKLEEIRLRLEAS